jgi:hypothetical protein
MASLTGNFIKDTYQSLLKIIDNGNVTESAKEITDGEGNSLGVSVDTSGNVTATGTIQGATVTNGTTSISDLQTGKEDKSEKGAASGYAPLDINSKVPTANLPDSVLGQLEYKGTWNADTDTPSLPSASTVKGNYYVVSTAGVYETIDYEIGDWIVSNGTAWEKVDNSDKVSSVNGATGAVVLDTDNIDEGTTNQYYTSDRANSDFDTRLATKDTSDLTEGSNLYYTEDRVSANTDVAANTAKTGITEAQASAIVDNTAKNSYPSADALKLSGIEEGAEVNVQSNWNATSGDALILNKPTTISAQQTSDIATNNAKVGITTGQADAIVANTAKTGITTEQADAIVANTAKVGITTQQASDITANNAKVGITTQQAADIVTNNAKVGITAQQASDITTNNAKISFDSTSSTKLGTIAENADDTANVTAAGALMDSEVDADIKTLSLPANTTISDFAKTILDDADASTVRTTIGAGTSSLVLGTTAGTALEGDTVIPTNNNQLTNGAGYINEAAQTIHTNAIGNAIDFSARVTLDGGVAEGTSGIIKNLQNIL